MAVAPNSPAPPTAPVPSDNALFQQALGGMTAPSPVTMAPQQADTSGKVSQDFTTARTVAQNQPNMDLFNQALGQQPTGTQGQSGDVSRETPATAAPPVGPRAPLLTRIGQGIEAVGSDIGQALMSPVDTLKQIPGGMADAAKNAFHLADEFGDWLNTHVADLRVPAPAGTPGFLQDPLKAISGAAEAVAPGQATTGTGQAIRSVSQFLTGFIPILGQLKALGVAGAGANIASAFTTAMTVFEPAKQNLANLIQSVPALKNPVTEALQANPGDPEWELRLKTGLEAAGLQTVAEGLIGAVKVIKGFSASAAASATPPGTGGDFSGLEQPQGAPTASGANPTITAEAVGATPPSAAAPLSYEDKVVAAEWAGHDTPGNPHYGPVQASDDWWAQFGAGGDRENIADAKAALNRETDFNTPKLEAALGHAPTDGELYLAHQQGLQGAIDLLTKPDEAAAKIVGEAAVTGNGGTADMTAGQFAQHVQEYFETKAEAGKPGAGGDFSGLGGGKGTGFAAGEGQPARNWLMVGDKNAPPVTYSPESAKFADEALTGTKSDALPQINMAHIEGPEDVKSMVDEVAKSLTPQLDRAAPQSWETTNMLARSLGLDANDVIRMQAQGVDAAQMRAMSLVNVGSAQSAWEYTDRYMADPTPENKALAVKALMTQRAVTESVLNARTSAARTLNILAQATGPEANYTEAMNRIVQGIGQSTEPGEIDQFLGRVHSLGDPASGGDPTKIAEFLGREAAQGEGGSKNLITKVWINALLSKPTTVAKKFLSDATMAVYNLASRYTAAAYSQTLGSGEVSFSEANNLLYGNLSAVQDAFRMAYKGITTGGESQFKAGFSGPDAMDAVRGGYLTEDGTPDVAAMRQSKIAALAKVMPTEISLDDPIKSGAAKLAGYLPTGWLNAVNDFWEYIHYNGARYALASRDATSQGLEGDAYAQHIDGLIQNTPSWLHEQSVNEADNLSFLGARGPISAGIHQAVEGMVWHVPGTGLDIPIGKLIIPFDKIPFNIVKTAFQNSALGIMSRDVQTQLAMGGASRDVQIAKLALGGMANLAILGYALGGKITGDGPHDPDLNAAWRRAGNQPNSTLIGGRWVDLHQIEPFGMIMSATANTVETMKFAHEDGRTDLATSLALGWAHALTNTPFMTGLSGWLEAMATPDSARSQGVIDRTISAMAVPQAVYGMAQVIDPWLRMHRTLLTDIESRTPGMSSKLPPLTDLWGYGIPREDQFAPWLRMVNPMPIGQPAADAAPIDKWVWDNRSAFPRVDSGKLGLQPPPQVPTYQISRGVSVPVQLTDAEYYRFKQLAGHALKDPATGLGAEPYLSALVKGTNPNQAAQNMWDNSTPAAKALIVQSTVHIFQRMALGQMRNEFPDIDDAVKAGAGTRIQQLQGATP